MSLELNLTHRAGAFSLDVNISVGAGVTAIFGRSGAGKTTLINAVSGLIQPDSGKILHNGVRLFDSNTGHMTPAHARRMGYVFQDARLFPHMNVTQNLTYGARFAPKAEAGPSLDDVVDLLGLEALRTRSPVDLSGGEKQRVALGRALLSKPKMLLMDEPLAALDTARKDEILPYLERLKSQGSGLPILYVSHALDEVARLADHLVVLDKGRVAASGDVFDVLSDPSVVPILGVRQAGAVLQAKVESHEADGLSLLRISGGTLALPGVRADVGTSVRLRVLAQDIILSRDRPDGLSTGNVLPVIVHNIRTGDGPGAAIALRAGSDRLLARVPVGAVKKLGLSEGLRCFAILNATSVAPGSIGR